MFLLHFFQSREKATAPSECLQNILFSIRTLVYERSKGLLELGVWQIFKLASLIIGCEAEEESKVPKVVC